MITENVVENQSQSWQIEYSSAIRDVDTLLKLLQLPPDEHHYQPKSFALRVPRSYVNKMKKGDWNDPLLRQVLPISEESQLTENFLIDPVGDLSASQENGVLRKYASRALIITTGSCPIHCRYCFRQHFPYSKHQARGNEWADIIASITADSSINEVILSGGDPLSLSDSRLQSLCQQLNSIPHIKILRIHTRFPLVLPKRIGNELIDWLTALSLQVIMVIHANHSNEFCEQTADVLARLHRANVLLFNQSVLLKGVNDSSEVLVTLSHTLIKHHVVPYYLHQLDRVQGAAHFEVDDATATALINELRLLLPGYLVPRLVREITGELSKTPI